MIFLKSAHLQKLYCLIIIILIALLTACDPKPSTNDSADDNMQSDASINQEMEQDQSTEGRDRLRYE